jgi:UDPglucose 6-dehydrogenase
VLLRKITAHFGGPEALAGKKIAVWGLAFKPRTDDLREAPSLDLIRGLLAAGATVTAHDPEAMPGTRALLGDAIELLDDHYACLDGADALCICTEWSLFRRPDFDEVKRRLAGPVIFDGRNLYDPDRIAARGFTYYAIGRGTPLPV